MMELVKAFANIASLIETSMFYKMKQLGYSNAMLYLYKNKDHKLPSITSTANLGTSNWKDTEANIEVLNESKSEDDWIKYFKEIYEYVAAPQDITKCSLT